MKGKKLRGLTVISEEGKLVKECSTTGVWFTTPDCFALDCLMIDKSTGAEYKNVGTVKLPVWERIGEEIVDEVEEVIEEVEEPTEKVAKPKKATKK